MYSNRIITELISRFYVFKLTHTHTLHSTGIKHLKVLNRVLMKQFIISSLILCFPFYVFFVSWTQPHTTLNPFQGFAYYTHWSCCYLCAYTTDDAKRFSLKKCKMDFLKLHLQKSTTKRIFGLMSCVDVLLCSFALLYK